MKLPTIITLASAAAIGIFALGAPAASNLGAGRLALRTENLTPYAQCPMRNAQCRNVRAFLAVIRWAEGTSGADGYKTQYTFKKFGDFSDHPRSVNCGNFNGKRLCSDAAGAYQFLSSTWDTLDKKLNLPDFSPASQDRAAVELLRQNGALAKLEKGDFEGAVFANAGTWAPLPNSQGVSALGQRSRRLEDLRRIYVQFGGTYAAN
ncbi:MAG: glycoside hydrolase family 104 protein [Oscillatoria princeps RMCB-10]|jgi:muramidase (phage lysozyme)|nr:glycoside hydrolase family 104 protein [Oscillatoria princeps RMCB-10]